VKRSNTRAKHRTVPLPRSRSVALWVTEQHPATGPTPVRSPPPRRRRRPVGSAGTGDRNAGCAIVASNHAVVPNINRPEFDEPREHEGFRAKRARLGQQLGSERVGASLWELPAGQAAYPYHYHLTEEEMVVVIAGTPILRTPDGWRELEEGEVVSFARGERGAHQIVNHSRDAVRFIAVSTHGDPDIAFYPDSNKIGASERLPRGGGLRTFFRLDDQVDYWHGEVPPVT
jgi:uncharacterized cupin superfamily protein